MIGMEWHGMGEKKQFKGGWSKHIFSKVANTLLIRRLTFYKKKVSLWLDGC